MSRTTIIAPGARNQHYWSDLWRYRGLLGFLEQLQRAAELTTLKRFGRA